MPQNVTLLAATVRIEDPNGEDAMVVEFDLVENTNTPTAPAGEEGKLDYFYAADAATMHKISMWLREQSIEVDKLK
jgi:hypothetical protein